MSDLWKTKVNGKEVLFVNSSRGTRYGFAHDTELFIDGRRYGKNTAYYINRTWERYCYQTVMRGCVWDLMERRKERLKEDYKTRNGYKRMTAERQTLLDAEISDDAELKLYKNILKKLGR